MGAATPRIFQTTTGPEKFRLELHPNDVLRIWGRILTGYKPFLSIEITRECPLRCPGCYAYEPQHLGGGVTLRQLSDYKADELVRRVLTLVDELRPLHVSIVGGDPLVRFRELQEILPALSDRGIAVFLITSAFRKIPDEWFSLPGLDIVVSIDGLQPEHDERRKPATYDRILQSVAGNPISIHCTVTSLMARRGYLEEFLRFWSNRPETRRILMSLFTPQRGATNVEILSPEQRRSVVEELAGLAASYPKLDMNGEILREFLHPPSRPEECMFARITETVSADLKTRIAPCQFGGDPDCSQCGCFPSMVLARMGHKATIAGLTASSILKVSAIVGAHAARIRSGYSS
jgi:MoaA/NifB/PqqE/SkfB family radical SAM enzyme